MRIRDFAKADFKVVRSWFPDEEALLQWGGPDLVFPLDDAQLAAMLPETIGPVPARWLFSGLDEEAVVAHGQVALDWRHGVARLSRIAVAPTRRGTGLAKPFLDEILARIFERPEFERVELNVYTFNQAAIRTYRRLGFVEEGVRRATVRVGNRRWDTAMFGLLRGDPRPS